MSNFQFNIQDVPQELLDTMRQSFEADPKIRYMRIQQGICQRQHNFRMALAYGKQIEDLFARVVQTYLEDAERDYEEINLTEAQLPVSDRQELMEIILTLFLAADIIDTAARDFNDVLHRSDKSIDMVQFDDIKELAKKAKGKLEWFSAQTNYLQGLNFANKSDNMYTMLRNKARSLLKKTKKGTEKGTEKR